MPHIFPPRRFANGEIPDPDILNLTLVPLAGKVSGKINEHDIAQGIVTTARVTDEAYYDVAVADKKVDPQWTVAGVWYPYALSIGAGEPAADIPDSQAWGVLTDVSAPSEDLSVTITTGDDRVFVLAQVQYIAFRMSGGTVVAPGNTPSANNPIRTQFALRVDDVVVPETITGAHIWPDPPPQPFYRVEADATQYDFRQIRHVQNAVGFSPAMHPVRMTWAQQVPEGSHTIDVVSRRVPQSDGKIEENNEGLTVRAFNRQLFVLRIKGFSKATTGVPTLSVTAFEDGDVVSAASLFTNKIVAIKDTLNDLDDSAPARGAFRHEHLPSMVVAPDAAYIAPNASVPITSIYPGFETTSAAWTLVNDGAGNTLAITNGGTGWDLALLSGTLVVMANVEVPKIEWDAAGSVDIRAVGALAIAYTDQAGTRHIAGISEVYLNGHNPEVITGANEILNIEDDAPLTWVADIATLVAAGVTSISQIEVVGSVWPAVLPAPANVRMRTQAGCVFAFVLRNVTQ